MEAHRISDSRKIEPLNASGSSFQSGLRHGTHARIATHTAAPMKGKLPAVSGMWMLIRTFVTIAAARMTRTIATRAQSMRPSTFASLMIGECRCCCSAAGMPKITIAAAAAMYASSTTSGLTPSIHIMVVVVSPTTLPEPPAFDAATIAAR